MPIGIIVQRHIFKPRFLRGRRAISALAAAPAFLAALAACRSELAAGPTPLSPQHSVTQLPTATDVISTTETATPILPAAATSSPSATTTPMPSFTATNTSTALPAGYGVVPEIVGMHYEKAQQALEDAGFSYVFRDVFSREEEIGVIIGQNPAPGTGLALGEAVFAYRAFQVVQIRMGEPCQPLRVTSTSGRLRFSAYLEEDESYRISTDFSHGETVLFDYRMNPLRTIDNPITREVVFHPDWTGWYVLMIGPYQISQSTVDEWPEGVPMGEFCIIPPEYE
jgi:hypothetical protein